jgi:Protein of unknown function (DUF664)
VKFAVPEQQSLHVTEVPRLRLTSVSGLGAQAGERELLTGFLDWYRAVVESKVADLSLEDASRIMTPTGLSPLGIVKHLGDVERRWFQLRFAGADVAILRRDDVRDADFRIDPEDTVASVVEFYRASTSESRRITEGASLDAVSVTESPHFGCVSLRWILVHMIEETARHAGHLDLMREQIDGKTGD